MFHNLQVLGMNDYLRDKKVRGLGSEIWKGCGWIGCFY